MGGFQAGQGQRQSLYSLAHSKHAQHEEVLISVAVALSEEAASTSQRVVEVVE